MKKLILAAIAVTCAASVFAQGTLTFNNRATGTTVSHVYLGATAKTGNGAADFPVGTTDWSAYTLLSGSGYMAQVLTGTSATEASLVAQTGIVSFRTGAGAGFVASSITVSASNVAGDAAGFFEMVAWDSKGGTVTSWAQAQPLWVAGSLAAGESGPIAATFGGTGTPPFMTGLSSFSIYTVPEPSTFALAGLGMAAMLVLRRRK